MATDPGLAEAAPSTPAAEPQVSAGNPSEIQPSNQPAGEPGGIIDVEELVAGLKSIDDLQNLAAMLPPKPKGDPFGLGERSLGDVLMEQAGQTSPELIDPATDPEDPANVKEGAPLPKRLRIASLPEERQRAILAMSDASRPLEEILRALGSEAPAAAGEPTAGFDEIDAAALRPPDETPAALQRELADARKERLAAIRSADFERQAEIEGRIDELTDRLPLARQAEVDYESGYDRAFEASQAEATAAFPEAGNPNSVLFHEMVRMDQRLEKANDPLRHHPEKPMLLAARAAAKLGIAPRAKTPAAPTARPAPVSAAQPRAFIPPAPALGGARTAAPSTTAASAQLDQILNSAKDQNDLVNLLRQL